MRQFVFVDSTPSARNLTAKSDTNLVMKVQWRDDDVRLSSVADQTISVPTMQGFPRVDQGMQ